MARTMVLVVGILACMWAVLGPCSSAEALYSAKEVFKVHQGSFDVATDLHIKFWQKEDDIDVTNWQVGQTGGGLGPPDSQGRGNQPEPWHSRTNGGDNPDNGMHAVDLDWDDLSIPFCTDVWLEFTWWLTEKNTKRVQVEWTKDGQRKKPTGNNGWSVDGPRDLGGGQWAHTVRICNDEDETDPNAPSIHLRNIKYSSANHYNPISADELWNWDTWTMAPVSDTILAPGECMAFDVITDFGDWGHILGSYEVVVEAKGGKFGPLESRVETFEVFDHPTPPEPGTLLLLGLGTIAVLRRRGRTA